MAAECNVFNEASVDDLRLAALLSYSGFAVIKCKTTFDTVWIFRDCKKFDLEIYEAEVSKPDTVVELQPFCRAMGLMLRVQSMARKNNAFWGSAKGWYSAKEEA